jgi:hypothetical protein
MFLLAFDRGEYPDECVIEFHAAPTLERWAANADWSGDDPSKMG